MAICRDKKYSQEELQKFFDKIVNVLVHDVCREEYRTFLKEIRRNDLIKILKVWEYANDIVKNPPGSPERRRKLEHLEELAEEVPMFAQIMLFNNDANMSVPLSEKAAEELEKNHECFAKYLRDKYG